MHRTQGEDFVTESGKRRFADRDTLLGIPGTVDSAEYNNAVQEEICYIIEQYGGDCNITASADRILGWHALHDTIFLEGNITDDAISDMSVDKLTPGLDTTGGITYNWSLTKLALSFDADDYPSADIDYDSSYGLTGSILSRKGASSNGVDQNVVSYLGQSVKEMDDTAGTTTIARTDYKPRGIYYHQRFGDSTVLGIAQYRKEAWDISSVSWSDQGNGVYLATLNLDTGIPWDDGQEIIYAHIQWSQVGNRTIGPVTLGVADNASQLRIVSIKTFFDSIPSTSDITLVISYNASVLSSG